jgi:menaquinone-dependent protoporphyrinogen oxidase
LRDAAPALVAFASRDGHAARIARRLADGFAREATPPSLHDLATGPPAHGEIEQTPLAVLVAAVRYGRHLAGAERFLEIYRGLARPPALALVSVNLTARKPEKNTPATNPYLRKLMARHGVAPVAAAVFAGRLDYPRYGWFDRTMIRLIMALTGGPTDRRAVVDYTPWDEVDAFAAELRMHLATPRPAPAPARPDIA